MDMIGQRIVVLGVTGSGKSTLSRTLADLYDLQYVELDNLFWKAGWQESCDDEFLDKVRKAIGKSDRWIVDGNYMRVGAPYVWQRADSFIWLDYPLRVNIWRLWKRTWGRFLKQEALWEAQNRESLWKHFLTRDSLFWYALQSHSIKRQRYTQLFSDEAYRAYNKLHFQSPTATADWLIRLNRDID